nr:hypothetical protein [Tanacetum cinerariifolium]
MVSHHVIDMMVEKEKISSLEDTTVAESFSPISTSVTTTAGNAPGKSSYANITGKPSGKKVNVRTLFTPGGNGIDVVVPVNSIRAISEQFANTAYGFFLWKKVAYRVVANYVRNTWAMKEDVSTVSVWVKLYGVPVTAFCEDGLSAIATKLGTPLMLDSYTSNMCMQSEGRSSYARVRIELQTDVELKNNIVVAMPKITRENIGVGEKKTMKKPSQTSRGVSVGPKMRFKPPKEYRHVLKMSTASSSGNKKKCVEPIIEVSNSNPFDVLNSVDNDVKFGTNGGTTNLVNNEATSSGSSFMNVDSSSFGATPIIDKIRKFENLLTSGQVIHVDKAGNHLKKLEFSGEYDSEDEYVSVDNDMPRSMRSEMDLSHELQAICDNLDIRVRGGKKK